MKIYFKKTLLLFTLLGFIQSFVQAQNNDFIKKAKHRTFIINYSINGKNIQSTGFLINDSYIITCAHAVSIYEKKDTIIKLGEHLTLNTYIEKFLSGAKPQHITVGRNENENLSISNVYIYPGFKKNKKLDIAIIKLNNPLNIESNYKIDIHKPDIGDTILFLGYSEMSKSKKRRKLSQKNINPWFNTVTKNDDSLHFNFETYLTKPSKLANYNFGRITDAGDSGGPSFLLKNNKFYLTGIHQQGVKTVLTAEGKTPDGFVPYSKDANLFHFEKWIFSIINDTH